MAYLIAIEGPDTAGKSTQATLLKDKLKEQQEDAVILHFPTAITPIGKMIQSNLRGNMTFETLEDRVALQMMYLADMLTFQKAIEDHLEEGIHVIVDRYTYSTYIYSRALLKRDSELKGDSIRRENELSQFISQMILTAPIRLPDLLVVLNLPKEEVSRRKQELDSFESDQRLMELVSTYYAHHPVLIEKYLAKRPIQFIDATLPIEQIHGLIMNGVSEL